MAASSSPPAATPQSADEPIAALPPPPEVEAPPRGRIVVLHDRFVEPDETRPRACLAALLCALERSLPTRLSVETVEVPLDTDAVETRPGASRNTAFATVLPTGKFAGIVILFSAVQPRSLAAANSTLDACLHAAHVPTALCAVHVPLLEAATVRGAHEAAAVPLLSWDVLTRFCASKECMLYRAGLPRPVVPFALSLLPTSASSLPTGRAGSLADDDRDCVDDLARWLTYCHLHVSQQQAAAGRVQSPRGPRAMMEPPPPPPPEDLRASVWTAHVAAGAARREGLANSNAWFGVRVTAGGASDRPRTLYAHRGTKELSWRAPQALVDAALSRDGTPSGSAYTKVRELSQQPETLYMQRKAMAQQAATAASEATQLAENAAVQRETSQPALADVSSVPTGEAATQVSARAAHLQDLQASVSALAQERARLKVEAAARAEELDTLQRQLAMIQDGGQPDASSRVVASGGADGKCEEEEEEVHAAKAQLAALELEIAHRKTVRAEVDDWAPNRSRLTTEYVDHWKANQAVRAVLRGIKKEAAKLEERHRSIEAGRVAALDRRRQWLDERISSQYRQLDQLHGPVTADARHDIRSEQLRIDHAVMRHRESGVGAAWERKELAVRVFHKEAEAAAQHLQRVLRRGVHAHDALLCTAEELRDLHARRCALLEQRHREAASCTNAMREALRRPGLSETEVTIAQMVAKDADIASLMAAEALARGCMLETDQALELTGAVAAWHAGGLAAAERALVVMRHKADAL